MKRKLTKTELRKISIGLPDIKKQLYENRELYQSIYISVFEKPLKEEECWQIYDTDKKTIAERRKKLEDLLVEFFSMTDIYLWRHKRHYSISFYKPSSLQNLLRHCDIPNQTWESGHRYDILLPEFSAVYSEEWDWTTIVWYRDYEKIKPLLDAVKKSGLYFYH